MRIFTVRHFTLAIIPMQRRQTGSLECIGRCRKHRSVNQSSTVSCGAYSRMLYIMHSMLFLGADMSVNNLTWVQAQSEPP